MMLRAEILLHSDRTPKRVVGILLDINDRKLAEEALADRDATIRAALHAASMAVADFNYSTLEFKSSPELSVIYGYPADHVLTIADIRARYHPDDVGRIYEIVSRASAGKDQTFDMEFRLVMPDGCVKWIKGVGEYIRDEHGKLLRSRGIVRDITEQKAWEASQVILINELNHRVKNTLAIVQSITRQTLAASDTGREATQLLEERLAALAAAHDVLTRESWTGANLQEIISDTLQAWLEAIPTRFRVAGPPVRIASRCALILALVLQELATNAAKYGALSNSDGIVEIGWSLEEGKVLLEWSEARGPIVKQPERKGFGSRMIERSMSSEAGGSAVLTFPSDGLRCRLGFSQLAN